MKVLAITGHLAKSDVKTAIDRSRNKADVLVLDIDVASFITPELLRFAHPVGYDLILLPGAITADFRPLEEELRTSIRLGPKHAVDLEWLLDLLPDVELSRTVPACVLLSKKMKDDAIDRLESLEAEAIPVFTIRGLKIGGNSRMKVLAEIVDAPKLTRDALEGIIARLKRDGADMIDLGLSLDSDEEAVCQTVRIARHATDMPISIDTLDPRFIEIGIDEGVDLVLSLNESNIRIVGPRLAKQGIPAVVIPGPNTTLSENLHTAESLGIKSIADPVLNPPLMNMTKSIADYMEFSKSNPQIPLFFGIGNVTELIDADSQGVNALLASIAAEVNSSILFTPEYSAKAIGSVSELKVASMMMKLAIGRKSTPKDLGLDLLVVKEKRRRAEGHLPSTFETVDESYKRKVVLDPRGSFKIRISNGNIVLSHKEINLVGKSAKTLLEEAIDRNLVSRLDHAGYLGRELAKAELAINYRRSYSQDDPF